MTESGDQRKFVDISPLKQPISTDSSTADYFSSGPSTSVRWFVKDCSSQRGCLIQEAKSNYNTQVGCECSSNNLNNGCIELQRLNSDQEESAFNGNEDDVNEDDNNKLLISTSFLNDSISGLTNQTIQGWEMNRYRRSTAMELVAVCFLLILAVIVSFSASGYHQYTARSTDSTTENEFSSYLLFNNENTHNDNNFSIVAQPLISSSFEPEVIDSLDSSALYNHFVSDNQTNEENSLKPTHFESLFQHVSPYLRRVMLKNSSATCNDGTNAGYYLRLSKSRSKKWIVFLEGGWFCYSTYTCHLRWLQMRNLMSSAHWPELRSVGGILSPDHAENPFYYEANHVFVPYCSSDSWSGDAPARSSSELSFLGARILENVIFELLKRGLRDANLLILAGSSAGAGGVLVNLDRVAQLLQLSTGSKVKLRGLADSGWFLDNQPFFLQNQNALYARYMQAACREGHICPPLESIKQGLKLWNGRVPEACRVQHPDEPWKCFFGYRIYRTLKTPLFVVQWLFDEAQMAADNVANPMSRAQWDYIHKMGLQIRSSLENVTGVFAPSCISHIVLTTSNWAQVKINQISLPQAINCWEIHQDAIEDRIKRNHLRSSNFVRSRRFGKHHYLFNHLDHHFDTRDKVSFNAISDNHIYSQLQVSSSSSSSSSLTSRMKKPRKKKKRRKIQRTGLHSTSNVHSMSSLTVNQLPIDLSESQSFAKESRNRRSPNDPYLSALASLDRNRIEEPIKCSSFRLMDSCSWPQCNHHCPALINPLTGEQVQLTELLRSFGFNMASFASSMGIDPQTFNSMDQRLLLQLLTTQG